jgi:hypothetical protein
LHINQISIREKQKKAATDRAPLSRTSYLNTMSSHNSTIKQSPTGSLNFTKRRPPQFECIPKRLDTRRVLELPLTQTPAYPLVEIAYTKLQSKESL